MLILPPPTCHPFFQDVLEQLGLPLIACPHSKRQPRLIQHPPTPPKNPSTTDSSFMTDNVRYILLKSTVRLLFFFLIRTCDSRNNIIIIFSFFFVLFYMFTYHHEVKSLSLVSTVNNNSADCGAIKRKKEECAEVFPSH
jgi:hypothetical protein